jgi:hypothetical protein
LFLGIEKISAPRMEREHHGEDEEENIGSGWNNLRKSWP